jgi:hypothetical protein
MWDCRRSFIMHVVQWRCMAPKTFLPRIAADLLCRLCWYPTTGFCHAAAKLQWLLSVRLFLHCTALRSPWTHRSLAVAVRRLAMSRHRYPCSMIKDAYRLCALHSLMRSTSGNGPILRNLRGAMGSMECIRYGGTCPCLCRAVPMTFMLFQ